MRMNYSNKDVQRSRKGEFLCEAFISYNVYEIKIP